MSDVLTDRLRKYLAAQGRTASDTDLARILEERRKELTAIDPTFKRKASMADAIGTGLWHAFESSTFGIPGLVTESKLEERYGRPWDEKDTNERIAAAIGEVAGLVNPYGAFGLMSKGLGKGVGYLTGKGTSKIFKDSARDAVGKVLANKTEKDLVELGIKKGLTSSQRGAVSQSIKNTFTDKLMKQKTAEIAGKGTVGKSTGDTIESIVAPAINKALADAGVTSGRRALSAEIAATFRAGVDNGKHLNSISRLVASGMGGVNQTSFRKGLNKYVGMAVQDMVLLTSYNSLAGGVEAKKSGEAMDWGSTLKHSLYLSLAFPAIRRIPGGGRRTLREGNFFRRGWNSVNYKNMDEDTLGRYLAVMYGGKKAGSNLLKGQTFTLSNGKQIKWGASTKKTQEAPGDFRKIIDDLDHSEMVELAEQIRAFGNKGFTTWGKAWLWDLTALSMPRMAMGAAANNVDMFKSGMWARIPPEELLTHLLIGAFFTRSRGEWNHGRPDRTSLKDYKELFHITGLKPKDENGNDLMKWLDWNEVDILQQMQGAAFATNPTLKPMLDIIKKYTGSVKTDKNGNFVDESGKKIDYSQIDVLSEHHLSGIVEYFNLVEHMKVGLDPDYTPFMIEQLPHSIRAKLNAELANHKISLLDGQRQPYSEVGKAKLDTQLTIELGDVMTTQVKTFLERVQSRLKDELQIDYPFIDASTDNVTRLQLPTSMGEANPESRSLQYLLGLKDMVNNTLRIGKQPTKGQEFSWDKSKEQDIDRIISEEKAKLQDRFQRDLFGEYAESQSFDLFDSDMLGTISRARQARVEQSWLNIIDRTINPDTLTKHEKDIRQIIATLFVTPVNGVVPSWSIIKANLTKKSKNIDIADAKHSADINTLRTLYELYRIGKTTDSSVEMASKQGKIDLGTLKELRDAVDLGNIETSTGDYGTNRLQGGSLGGDIVSKVTKRWFDHEFSRFHDPSKIHIMRELMDIGVGIRIGKQIQVMNREAVEQYLRKKDGTLSEEELRTLGDHYQQATEGYLGNLGGTIKWVDRLAGSNPEISRESIEKMHKMVPEVWWNEASGHVRKLQANLFEYLSTKNYDIIMEEIQFALADFATLGTNPKTVTDNINKSFEKLENILKEAHGYEKNSDSANKIAEGNKILKDFRAKVLESIKDRGVGNGQVNVSELLGDSSIALREAVFEILKPNHQMAGILEEIAIAGNHIHTRPESYKFYEFLKNQLLTEVGKSKMTEVMDIEQLIETFNNSNKGVADWLKIVKPTQDFIDQTFGSRDKSTSQISRTQAYLKLSETHHRMSSDELADKYFIKPEIQEGLVGGGDRAGWKSPFHPAFVGTISLMQKGANNNPHFESLIKFVESQVNNSSLNARDKTQRLEDFMNYGMYHIVNAQLSQTRKPYLVFQNGFWVEKTTTQRKTQRHQFMDMMAQKGVDIGEILTTAVDGNEVNIYSLLENPTKLIELTKARVIREADQDKLIDGSNLTRDDLRPSNGATSEGIIPVVASAANAFYIPKSQLVQFGEVFSKHYTDTVSKIKQLINSKKDVSLSQKENLKIVLENYKTAFKDLANEATTSDNAEMKFVSMYMNEMNPVKLMELFGLNNENAKIGMHRDADHGTSWGDKIIKYSKTYEAQNQTPLTSVGLELMSKHHPLSMVRDHAEKKLTSTKILGVADENAGSFADVRTSILKDLEAESMLTTPTGEGDPLKGAIDAMRAELMGGTDANGNKRFEYDSLGRTERNPDVVSSKNGVVYISEAEARVLTSFANETFNPNRSQVINGFKPKISFTDGIESLQQKTWYIYSPRLEGKMKELGVDQIAFGSALKTFGSLRGDKELKDIQWNENQNNKDSSWETNLIKGELKNNIIDVTNPESISIGYINHPGRTVSAGNTVTNLVPRELLTQYRIWQGLEGVVEGGIGLGRQMHLDARTEIAEVLYDWQKQDSGGWISDDASLIQTLLQLGANTTNVAVKGGIERIWTSKVLGQLRRPQLETGISSYLAHDELFLADGPRQKLKNPVYAEAGNGKRSQLRLGDVYAPSDWANKSIQDVNQLRFVVSLGGVDVVVGYDSNRLFPKEKGPDRWEVIDPTEGMTVKNLPKGWKFSNYANVLNKVKGRIDGIQERINNQEIGTIQDVMDALAKLDVPTVSTGELQIPKIGIAANTLAIPRKSADMVINRVAGILDPSYGNNWFVNDYELAITHQRDFDGDHFFVYNDMPMQSIKNNLFQTAQIRDYPSMSREKPEINPFGFNSNLSQGKGAANEGNTQSIASYLSKIESRRRIIGTLIGLNQPLSWMSNLDIQLRIDGVSGGEIEKGADLADVEAKSWDKFDFIMTPDNINRTIDMHHRVGTTGQNTIEFYGGKSSMLSDIDMRTLLFGGGNVDSPRQYQRGPGQDTRGDTAMRLSDNPENAKIQVDILTAISRKLQKASIIFNDTYEGGKKRDININDLGEVHRDIQAFFSNPNKAIFTELMMRAGQDKVAQRDIVRYFYGKNEGRWEGLVSANKETEAISELLDSIFKNRGIPEPENVIRINLNQGNKGGTRSKDRWEANNAGFAVRAMFENSDAFRSPDMLQGFGKDVINPKDRFTPEDMANNIFEFTVLQKAFGIDAAEKTTDAVYNIIQNKENLALRRNMMDATSFILNSKLSTARGRVAFLEGGKYPNREELSRAREEVANLEMAVQNIKQAQIRDVQMGSAGKEQKQGFTHKRGGDTIGTSPSVRYIYSLKDGGVESGTKLDYKNVSTFDFLKFEQVLDKNEKYRGKLPRGKDYVIMDRPIERIPLTKMDAVQGISWLNATRGINSDGIAIRTGNQGIDLVSDVQSLKRSIQKNFGRAMDSTSKSPALKGRIWKTERTFAFAEIGRFMKKWTRDLAPNEKDATIQELSLILLTPDPVNRAILDTKVSKNAIPYFRISKRVHKHVFGWLNENRKLRLGDEHGVRTVEEAIKYAADFENYIAGHHKAPDGSIIKTEQEIMSQWAKNEQVFGKNHSTIQSLFRYTSPFRPLVQVIYEKAGLVSASSYQKGTKWGSHEAGYMFWQRAGNIGKYLRHEVNKLDFESTTGAKCG